MDHLLEQDVGMRSLLIIGNSTTRVIDGRMVTPRGYEGLGGRGATCVP